MRVAKLQRLGCSLEQVIMCEGEISGELFSNIFEKATVTKIAEIVDDVISRKFLNYLETVKIRAISLMKSVIRRLFRKVN